MFIADGKGGHQRLVPMSSRFFTEVVAYLDTERPADASTDRVFVVLKGPNRGQPLSVRGLDEMLTGARRRAGLAHATCHELRHTCLTRLREAGMALEAVQAQAGHASIESTRIYLHLADDWLANQYRGRRGPRRPALPRDSPVSPAATAPARGRNGMGSLPSWEQLEPVVPQVVDTHASLPDPDRLRAATGQRDQRRHRAALLRRLPRRAST